MLRARTTVATATLASLTLGIAACGTEGPSTAAAVEGPSPSPAVRATTAESAQQSPPATPAAPGSPILRGKRQVVIAPVGSFESVLAVDTKGRMNATDGPSEYSLFVFVPARDGKHLIRTAKAGTGGEPSCMGIRNNGSAPLTVVAAACDAGRDGQLFTVATAKDAAKKDEPAYTISNGDAFLLLTPQDDLIAQEPGDAPSGTTFTLVDNGSAPT